MTIKANQPKSKAPQQTENTTVKVIAKKAPAATASKKAKAVTIVAVKEKVANKAKLAGSKTIRDKFSMPQSDYATIDELKQLCLKSGVQVKKNQLLRAGLRELKKMNASQLKLAISGLDQI